MFSEKDFAQFKKKGIDQQQVESQVEKFKSGFPFINLSAPAVIGNGIKKFSPTEVEELADFYEMNAPAYSIVKFVPASGAASRMFKSLFEFFGMNDHDVSESLENDRSFNSPHTFFMNLRKFPFFDELSDTLKKNGHNIDSLLAKKEYRTILKYFLTVEGMEYASLPKGLLAFHQYDEGPRKAVEEHMVEAANYSVNDKTAKLHLTVSPEHQEKFSLTIGEKSPVYEKKYEVHFDVSFSWQKPSTDTLAVDLDNKPFRNADNSLLFRPGGHGALIENLNDLDNDIIFIKNIDNVVPDYLKKETFLYKKVLGGLLIKLQKRTFEWLEMLEQGNLDQEEMKEVKKFAEEELNIKFPVAYTVYEDMERVDFLYNKINRPIRICGMVKNEGEPGGGPFWVFDDNDLESLQIVEATQINLDDNEQAEIVNKSTHFNPVDLVCGVKDFKGNKFNLNEYVDPETGFISTKSKDGKSLKALELPGLWNGAMADWITVFVEVPIETFNPVKIINDLLRPQHQPEKHNEKRD